MHSITFIQQNLGGHSPSVDTESECADIYFLQAVDKLTRPEITTLSDAGYKIVGFPYEKGEKYDAVIAINQNIFENVQIVKIYVDDREQVAAARVVHKASKQIFLLISGHSPRFSFRYEGAKLFVKARKHHEFILSIVHQIECFASEIIIGGFDMNNAPEKYRDSFDVLKENGVQCFRTWHVTQTTFRDVDPKTKKACFPHRETDYFLVRSAESCRPKFSLPEVAIHKSVEMVEGETCHLPIKLTAQVDNVPKLNLSGCVNTLVRSFSSRLST